MAARSNHRNARSSPTRSAGRPSHHNKQAESICHNATREIVETETESNALNQCEQSAVNGPRGFHLHVVEYETSVCM
jgi:hypothetical protein